MTPEIRIADRCLREGCFIAEVEAADAEERLRRAADPLTVPAWEFQRTAPEPPSRLFLWILLAFLALVLGVAAVAVWGSR